MCWLPSPPRSGAVPADLLTGAPADGALVRFRRWRETDAGALAASWTDPEIQRWTDVPADAGIDAARRWIAGDDARRARLLSVDLVVSPIDDAAVWGEVGLARVDRTRRAALLGYWVAPGARRRGVAVEAVGLVTDWALGVGGLAVIVARVEVANTASVRVLEATGYELLNPPTGGVAHYVRRG